MAELPEHGVSLSSLCTLSYLDRQRDQSRGLSKQDALVPCSSELLMHPPLCPQTTAEPAGTGESHFIQLQKQFCDVPANTKYVSSTKPLYVKKISKELTCAL